VETEIMFMDCPAYLDEDGAFRCGLPAEVEYRYTVESTDAPLESAKIRCPSGHWFNGPVELLTIRTHRGPDPAVRRMTSAG
jgi:hypothetical protein